MRMCHEQTSQEGPTSKVTSTVLWELTRVQYCNKKDRINKTILYFTDVPEDYCSLELLVGCDSYSQFVQLHVELVERAKTDRQTDRLLFTLTDNLEFPINNLTTISFLCYK